MRKVRFKCELGIKKQIATDTFELSIVLKEEGFSFTSGQYIWVILPYLSNSAGGDRRAFSIASSDKNQKEFTIIFRDSKSEYKKYLLSLEQGEEIQIQGPFGFSFIFDQNADKNILVIAGGTGLVPFLSWMRSGITVPNRDFYLLSYSSSSEKAFLTEELQNLSTSQNINLKSIIGKYVPGHIPKNINNDWSFYVSGPAGFINKAAQDLNGYGIEKNNINFEQYYPEIEGVITQNQIDDFISDESNIGLKAIKHSSHHIVITDSNAQILYANDAACNITGFSRDEMKGNTPRLWGGVMDREYYNQLWANLSRGESVATEIVNVRKNGEYYNAIARISPFTDNSGKMVAFIATEEDITKYINANRELGERQNELLQERAKDKAIFSSLGEGLVITDAQGKIVFVNKAFENLIGYKIDEVLNKEMVVILPKYDENDQLITKQSRSITRVLSGEIIKGSVSTLANTHYYLTKEKKKLYITGAATPIVINNQKSGAVQIFRDITKEKEFDKAKDEFLSIASHELRTPLAAIDGIVAMIRDGEYGPISDEVHEALDDVNDASERLIKLVNDLLSLSRMQAGRLKYKIETFDISKPVTATCGLFEVVLKKKSLPLKYNTVPIVVQADEDKVEQILNNLLNNAMKFTDKGSIEVTVAEDGDFAKIFVTDTGIGISPEDQIKLFGKFQQISNDKDRPPGTGLGLHLSQQMARKMGGDLWLEKSEVSVGTTFTFSVPKQGTSVAKKAKDDIEKEASFHPDQKSDKMEKK